MQNNFGVPDFDFKDYEICILKYGEWGYSLFAIKDFYKNVFFWKTVL